MEILEPDLKDIAARLNAIIETAIDGIITIDSRGRIETINQSAVDMFGYTKEEVIGANVSIFMSEPDRSSHDGYLERYLETKEAKIIGVGREVTGRKKDGTLFPLRLAVSEVVLIDRVIFTGVVHDMTEIHDANEKIMLLNTELEEKVEARTNQLENAVNRLLKLNRRLEENEDRLKQSLEAERELNELKSRFVSMASHEFRTPLSTILSSASIISKYKEVEQHDRREKQVGRIKSAVANLTGILNDFLSLSKLEEGKIEVNHQFIEFANLCSEIIGEVTGMLKSQQKIEHKVSGNEKPIHTDPRILKNIIFNLVSNTIKYSDNQSSIMCHAIYSDDTMELQIVDQGIGIPEEEQKFLFERFFRASNVENIQGTGLGLNIVLRYINMLNGSIRFISKEGVGTTFFVTIPIAKK